MAARYAVYFTPSEDSRLWSIGCAWLGRDPGTGRALEQPRVEGLSADRVRELTASPRLYGLHATLKPPFKLRGGATLQQLTAAIRALAARTQSFDLPLLEVGLLAGFVALRSVSDSVPLQALADASVVELDGFRHPPDEEELARRRSSGLTAAQDELLRRFGYPYVLKEWRFHITLTERLTGGDVQRLRPWLADHFAAALARPDRCSGLSLFVQPLPGADFRLLQRFPLNRK